jgi:uncharacterized RDD family membrane protein YckC
MSNLPPPPPPPPTSGPPASPPPGYQLQQEGYGYAYGPGPGAELAGFWRRLAALLVDGLIVMLFMIPAFAVAATGETEIDTCPNDATALCEVPTDETSTRTFLFIILGSVVGLGYFAVLEGTRGQTVGKKAMGIAVVDATTGQPIGIGRGIGRQFARWLSQLVIYLGYLWMLWDPKKQTWHDKLVKSIVVRRPA